jgi:hypothetical protein
MTARKMLRIQDGANPKAEGERVQCRLFLVQGTKVYFFQAFLKT